MSANDPRAESPTAPKAPAGAAPRTVPRMRQLRLWLSGLFASRYDGLHNFEIVDPGVLMRCGQPHVRDLEAIRTQHGIGTIVAARGGTRHPLRGRWFRKEIDYCRRHGIRFEHLPFSDVSAAPQEVFDRFLRVVEDPAARPVLLHCEQGFHRTGILVAAYRVRLCGWSVDRAVQEMNAAGFETANPKRRPVLEAFLQWAHASGAPRPS